MVSDSDDNAKYNLIGIGIYIIIVFLIFLLALRAYRKIPENHADKSNGKLALIIGIFFHPIWLAFFVLGPKAGSTAASQ
jgi:hypothetical protein